MEPVNVNELNPDGFKKFLSSFDHVFSDCDGVIWSGAVPLPGSGKFFEQVKKFGKTVHYVSNNSMRTKKNYEANFAACHIENGFENLIIPSTAIAEFLKYINLKKKVYCVACPETIRILEYNGFQCEHGPDTGVDNYADCIEYLQDDVEIGAVVVDSDLRVNLPKLNKACTYLRRPEVVLVNGATDRVVPLKPGFIAFGTGVFSDMIAQLTKRVPVQLGKPGKDFGVFAMKLNGVTDPSRVLFVGDMIEQDVAQGKVTGFKTLLVLTTTTEEEMMSHPFIKPDFYAASLGSIVPMFNWC